MRHVILSAAAVLAMGAGVSAEDGAGQWQRNWPQWRGPEANGVAPLATPPVEWGEDRNVKWKVELPGRGSGTPVIWEDRIYLLTAVPTEKRGEQPAAERRPERSPERGPRRPGGGPPGGGRPGGVRPGGGGPGGGFGAIPAPDVYYQFVLLCLDRATGETIWQKVAREEVPHEGHHGTNTFASASATTDGEFIYASFGSRGIYCYDRDGSLKWERDLGDMQTRAGFGEGSSPTLHQDTLIVNWDHEGESFIVALDAKTGEPRWKAERDEPTTWATPLVVENGERAQVITNGTTVRSYDLETGDVLWECGGQAGNPIASPILDSGLVYCMTGFRGYAVFAIPLDLSGDLTGSNKVAWSRTDTGPYIASPVLYEGLLYVTKGRDAILYCIDPRTGETVYGPERLPGLATLYASPVAADGKVYFTDRDGKTVVLEHGREFKVLAENKLDDGIDASPALVDNQMFLRGDKHLYCIEEGAGD